MDFELPPDDDPRRVEVRAWLADHPKPSGRTLAEAGYVVPHWPRPWGLEADAVHQLVLDDELARAGVRRPFNPIGIGWAGPTLLASGTAEQQQRWLPPLLAGDEVWCQLFSEPGAGSDLAGLSTKAVRDGDHFVVTGSKIWTSYAHLARWGILIARTDPDAPKQSGISYFVCPMDAPGITVRPIVEMTGGHTFNEVFLDEVHIPADHLVGELHRGWSLAKVTLANERVSLSSGGVLWGMGPTSEQFFADVRRRGGVADPLLRQRLARLYAEAEVLRLIKLRMVSDAVRGREPGPEASIRKALADEHGQKVMRLALDLLGPAGMLPSDDPTWTYGFLFAPALTIGGGTSEVQRNIIGERVLGLPGTE